MLETDLQRAEFVDYILQKSKDTVELSNVQIACISKIARNSTQASAVDVLIVGTERGSIYFIDSQAYTVLRHVNIGLVPTKILATGEFFWI